MAIVVPGTLLSLTPPALGGGIAVGHPWLPGFQRASCQSAAVRSEWPGRAAYAISVSVQYRKTDMRKCWIDGREYWLHDGCWVPRSDFYDYGEEPIYLGPRRGNRRWRRRGAGRTCSASRPAASWAVTSSASCSGTSRPRNMSFLIRRSVDVISCYHLYNKLLFGQRGRGDRLGPRLHVTRYREIPHRVRLRGDPYLVDARI